MGPCSSPLYWAVGLHRLRIQLLNRPPTPPPCEGCTALATGRRCQRVWVPFSSACFLQGSQPLSRPGWSLCAPRLPSFGQEACVDTEGCGQSIQGWKAMDTPRDSLGSILILPPQPWGALWPGGWGDTRGGGGHKRRRGTVRPHPATGGRPDSIGGGHGYLAAEPPLGSPRPGLHLGSIGPG